MEKKRFLESGKIVNTHGVKGELKIDPWCDSPSFLLDFKKLYIDGKPHNVQSARVHNKLVIISFEGISDINSAMRYKNKLVSIDRNDAVLSEGAWFIQDIIGLPVYDESGAHIGVLNDVLDLPASPVYVVKGKTEHLIPAVPEFLKSVDFNSGRITVSLIEGM